MPQFFFGLILRHTMLIVYYLLIKFCNEPHRYTFDPPTVTVTTIVNFFFIIQLLISFLSYSLISSSLFNGPIHFCVSLCYLRICDVYNTWANV